MYFKYIITIPLPQKTIYAKVFLFLLMCWSHVECHERSIWKQDNHYESKRNVGREVVVFVGRG